MDDPIFDPWSADAEEPRVPASPTPRWRSPVTTGPTVPPPKPAPGPPRGRAPISPFTVPSGRLAGTAGFLRTMAVPKLEEIARRLHEARHEASVEDELDATPALVRFAVRPWRGPWSDAPELEAGKLELAIEKSPEEHVVVRSWLDPSSDGPSEEAGISAAKLDAAWLEGLVLDFVKRVLART